MPWWEEEDQADTSTEVVELDPAVRVVDLADQYGLTTNDMLDLCDFAGVAVQGGGDVLTESQVARVEAALSGADPATFPVEAGPGAQDVAPGALGGWVSDDPPPPERVIVRKAEAKPAPPPAPPEEGRRRAARDAARDAGDVRGPKLHPLGALAVPLAFLPVAKMLIPVHLPIPAIAGGVLSTLVSMLLMAPAWTCAERAEEAERDEPDRWRGDHAALWAKALATLCMLVAVVWSWVRAIKGVSGF